MRLERYGAVTVLPVMAAPAEYGEHLRARIDPLMTGIGPVEGAVALTAALARLEARGETPDLILSLGSCGSRVLDHAAVYQASSVAYRDMDASALGFEKGVTPLLDMPAVLLLPCPIPGVPSARLSTGGNVVSGAAYDAIDAEMVDMETWALVRAAQTFGLPLVALRGVSDGKAELTGLHDWTSTLHLVDENLACAVDGLIAVLTNSGLSALEIPALQGQTLAQSLAPDSTS
ncbi:5'-methylthioadenosine/S-adenosylhomocysteine nucleosidase [Brevundimonas diminuta]|uniref:5'-methylthioadenosine/S-adenosylhomocysteine nucleosidase n=1 Tax=Brevundimonas diminuta TaxID=293 RepID=UPI00209809E9|nr:5'-methylthioadenosine/S-adenosylhomocysteine nucleosidase [Brevundimonas diminuta]MCO8019239.1 5'-methylthioadenosine/S-adenosylhomocysteine nucleosidase [Brevundimonas diminuta]MCO8021916.1 5'-methylthioadenosine/S-adenosylhomocysteine nucleosidase [Brevundimonas diminuta]